MLTAPVAVLMVSESFCKRLSRLRPHGLFYGIMCGMRVEEKAETELASAVDKYRSMCFWNLQEDFRPVTRAQKILALERLEKYGDLAAYRLAGKVREWL